MIISFQELKSEEPVLNLVFCLNYFDYSQSVGKWSVGRSIDNDQANIVTMFQRKIIRDTSYTGHVTALLFHFLCSIVFFKVDMIMVSYWMLPGVNSRF